MKKLKRLSESSRDKIYLLRNYPKKGVPEGGGHRRSHRGDAGYFITGLFLKSVRNWAGILPFIKVAAAKKAKRKRMIR